jgi:hypothetical protein
MSKNKGQIALDILVNLQSGDFQKKFVADLRATASAVRGYGAVISKSVVPNVESADAQLKALKQRYNAFQNDLKKSAGVKSIVNLKSDDLVKLEAVRTAYQRVRKELMALRALRVEDAETAAYNKKLQGLKQEQDLRNRIEKQEKQAAEERRKERIALQKQDESAFKKRKADIAAVAKAEKDAAKAAESARKKQERDDAAQAKRDKKKADADKADAPRKAKLNQLLAEAEKNQSRSARSQAKELDVLARAAKMLNDKDATLVKLQKRYERIRSALLDTLRLQQLQGKSTAETVKQIDAVEGEYQATLDNIDRAIDGQEAITNSTKEWLGLLREGHSVLGTLEKQESMPGSGKKSSAARRRSEDPEAYASEQFIFNSSRVAQDAPFGMLGIANNLDMFFKSFSDLRAQAVATNTTVWKSLLPGLKSGFGLMLAMNVATSLIIAGPKIAEAFVWLKAKFKGVEDHSRAIRDNMIEATSGKLEFGTGLSQTAADLKVIDTDLKAHIKARNAVQSELLFNGGLANATTMMGGAVQVNPKGTSELVAEQKDLNTHVKVLEKMQVKAIEAVAEAEAVAFAASIAKGEIKQRLIRKQLSETAGQMKSLVDSRLQFGRGADDQTVALAAATQAVEHAVKITEIKAVIQENVDLADKLKEKGKDGYEVYETLAQKGQEYVDFLNKDLPTAVNIASFELQKVNREHKNKLADMTAESAAMLLEGGMEGITRLAARRKQAQADEVRAIDQQMAEEHRETAESLAIYTALQEKKAAVLKKHLQEDIDARREAAEKIRDIDRSIEDKKVDARKAMLAQVRGIDTSDQVAEIDENQQLLELKREAENLTKDNDPDNNRLAEYITNELIPAMQEAFRLEKLHRAAMKVFAEQEHQIIIDGMIIEDEKRKAMREIENRIRARSFKKVWGMLSEVAPTIQETIQDIQDRAKLELEAEDLAFMNAMNSLESRIQAQTITEEQARREREQLELAHQQKMAAIKEGATDEELAAVTTHEIARQRFVLNVAERGLAQAASFAKSSADISEKKRAVELANEGKSQQEINKILYKERSKRFAAYQALAVAEAIISTYLAAQMAYAEGMKYGGPVVATASAAIAVASGMARVAAIRNTAMGSAPSAGAGSTGGTTYGAVSTTTANAAGSLPVGTQNRVSAQGVAKFELALGKQLDGLSERPIEVIIAANTQAQIADNAQVIRQRQTR